MKAIVTGHSRGLGAALANELLASGTDVLGLARSDNRALQQRYPRLTQQQLDMSDMEALRQWFVGNALEDFVGDDDTILLINNAALAGPLGVGGTLEVGAVGAALTLNVTAPLMLAERVLALGAHRERRIMHISSGASTEAFAGWSTYCASKAALDQHARSVAKEGQATVRVASVMPGVIDTGMQEQLRHGGEDFALSSMFVQMHHAGLLQSASVCAQRLVALLLDKDFGADPVLALDAGAPGKPAVVSHGTIARLAATHAD